MMTKMRTVICLLRNDLRVHDNEVLWHPFLTFLQTFNMCTLCRCCNGLTGMETTSFLSFALTQTISKELGTSTSPRQVKTQWSILGVSSTHVP